MKNVHDGKVVIGLVLILLVIWPTVIRAESRRIKVVVENASIRSEPDMTSRVIENPPFGSVFEVEKKVGEWYEIEFPSRVGILVTGYVHEMFVEVDKEVPEPPRTGQRRAFSLSASFGRLFPVGAMASASSEDDDALFRKQGRKLGMAGEYFFSPGFGTGLHFMITGFPATGYPSHISDPSPSNELGLLMIGAHGKLVLVSQRNARPYIVFGLGFVAKTVANVPWYGCGGGLCTLENVNSRPYILLGGGLDYSVSSRVSVFGELTGNLLIWQGAGVSTSGEGTHEPYEMDSDYVFLDLAVGISINLGAFKD